MPLHDGMEKAKRLYPDLSQKSKFRARRNLKRLRLLRLLRPYGKWLCLRRRVIRRYTVPMLGMEKTGERDEVARPILRSGFDRDAGFKQSLSGNF